MNLIPQPSTRCCQTEVEAPTTGLIDSSNSVRSKMNRDVLLARKSPLKRVQVFLGSILQLDH